MIYFQIFVMPTKTGFAAAKGLASMGPILTFVVMLGHMMQPLGILIIAYGYAKFRNVWWFLLVLVIVTGQVFIGFIEDIKMQAAIGIVLVIMVRTLRENRLPLGWIAAGLVFLVLAFPIFQAYRAEVTGARGLDREQAFRELGKVIDIVLASREKVTEGHNRSETFVERATNKHNVEILFDHVGVDVPLLYGHSLVGIPMAFVPRLLVPDKEDYSVGMMFGKQILKADGEVYISISHLGELYWNFGWPGVLFGMGVVRPPVGIRRHEVQPRAASHAYPYSRAVDYGAVHVHRVQRNHAGVVPSMDAFDGCHRPHAFDFRPQGACSNTRQGRHCGRRPGPAAEFRSR